MGLIALVDKREIDHAMNVLKATLSDGAVRLKLDIPTPAAYSHVTVSWHERHNVWSCITLEAGGMQYWCPYGMCSPAQYRSQPSIVQINPPLEGDWLHCQGTVAKDAGGDVHYLHTGQLGGGAEGIVGSRFVESRPYDGEQVLVAWPSGKTRPMFDFGRITEARIVPNLAAYVRACAVFRRNVAQIYNRPRGVDRCVEALIGTSIPPLFVSHCSADSAWCHNFVEYLRIRGATDVWYDEHDVGHGALMHQLEQELAHRMVFVVVLSPTALESAYVREEMRAAWHLKVGDDQRIILPVVKEQCEVPPFYLQYLRVSGPGDSGISPQEAARRVVEQLTSDSKS